ncbi:unnamed protein product [Moneuplotes crassus]|uniref:EML-like second beta-propeller domain-containing protein n=1 Tax=Euplotes crassus TaxID=5936 RepID=A0AAD1Y599_EUPCR|nr:unnamed protein product [Moneuplotes crassus]
MRLRRLKKAFRSCRGDCRKRREERLRMKIILRYRGSSISCLKVWICMMVMSLLLFLCGIPSEYLLRSACLNKHTPANMYEIDYVYGGKMNDKNMEINYKGNIVYTAGCLGIVLNPEKNKQKIFGGEMIDPSHAMIGKDVSCHTDEIHCVTLCPQRRLAATGQFGLKPWVMMWDTVKCKLLKKIRLKQGCKGIVSMCFSPSKPYKLAILDGSSQYTVWIYDIDPKHEEPISQIDTGSKEKYDIEWGLKEFELDEDQKLAETSLKCWRRNAGKEKTVEEEEKEQKDRIMNVIAVTGNDSAKFITFRITDIDDPEINYGVTLRKHIYDYTCCGINELGVAYTGTIDGVVLKWDVRTGGPNYSGLYEIMIESRTHTREITTLKCVEEYIITASLDGRIIILDSDLSKKKEIKTSRVLMALDYHFDKLVYTTKDGEIAYYNLAVKDFEKNDIKAVLGMVPKKKPFGPITVMNSHFSNEECGLVLNNNLAYTSGDDNLLIEIDYIEHQILGVYQTRPDKKRRRPIVAKNALLNAALNSIIPEKVEADHFECDLAFNDALGHLAVTHKGGKIVVKPVEDLNEVAFIKDDPKDSCECLEYSPDLKYLAVACYDCNIYIYKCEDKEYKLHKTLEKNPGGVFALDWELGGDYIRANCTNDEIVYWLVDSAKQIYDYKKIRDLNWDSHNCKLTWETKAVFPYGHKEDYINCCCTDRDKEVIATGDDDAFIRIHSMCCLKAHAAEMSVECSKYIESQDPPCRKNKEFIHKYRAHAGYIGRVCFDHDGTYLFSLGGNDKTLIQWKSVRS